MPRPAQSLQSAGDGAGTPHLQHLVNLSHVNAQFHRRCGAQKPQPPLPQGRLRLLPLLLCQAPMVHPGEVLPAQKIHIVSQLFRIPPALHKGNDAAAVLTILVHQRRQLLPHRVPALPLRVRIGAQNLETHAFFHSGSRHRHRLRSQVLSRPVQRGNGGG